MGGVVVFATTSELGGIAEPVGKQFVVRKPSESLGEPDEICVPFGLSLIGGLTEVQRRTLPRPIQSVYDHWSARVVGDRLPAWSDIDLMQVYKQAPFIMVKDRIEDPATGAVDFRNRFYGSGLAEKIGIDLSRRTLDDIYPKNEAAQLADFYENIVQGTDAIYAHGTCHLDDSKSHGYVGLYMPLFNANGEPAHVMCIVDFTSE